MSKTSLVRVVAVDGQCVPDVQARLPGRGAYVHLRLDCLEQAQRRRSLARALKVRTEIDLAPLFQLADQAE